jgi:BRO1-like domain
LDLRFPIDEDHIKLQFHWYDAFSFKKVTQHSIAFEKASVIFNFAATLSTIAALKDRSDVNGLKMAFNFYQASAGMFQFINDHFLHPPSVDMSRDSIKVLVDLMLGQAQECLIEKMLFEKKAGSLVAKLSMHLSSVFTGVVDGLKVTALKSQMPTAWVEMFKLKQKYFYALAFYHHAIQAGLDAKYGDVVTISSAAATHAQEALRIAEEFKLMYPKFSVSNENSIVQKSFAASLQEKVMEFAFDDENAPASTSSKYLS